MLIPASAKTWAMACPKGACRRTGIREMAAAKPAVTAAATASAMPGEQRKSFTDWLTVAGYLTNRQGGRPFGGTKRRMDIPFAPRTAITIVRARQALGLQFSRRGQSQPAGNVSMGSQPGAVAAGIGIEGPQQGFEIRHVLCPMLRMLKTLLLHKVLHKESVIK